MFKAIALFSELRARSFPSEGRKGKSKEAEQQAAEALRKKAAALFQQTQQCGGSVSEKGAAASLSLLEDVLRKYPQSGIEGQGEAE